MCVSERKLWTSAFLISDRSNIVVVSNVYYSYYSAGDSLFLEIKLFYIIIIRNSFGLKSRLCIAWCVVTHTRVII